jgi:hypothetical protein
LVPRILIIRKYEMLRTTIGTQNHYAKKPWSDAEDVEMKPIRWPFFKVRYLCSNQWLSCARQWCTRNQIHYSRSRVTICKWKTLG